MSKEPPTNHTFLLPHVRENLWQGKPITGATQVELVMASLVTRPVVPGEQLRDRG